MANLLTNAIIRLEKFISRQPLALGFKRRYPRLTKLISGRFDGSSFSGLTLTILVGFFIVATAILADLAEDVSEAESIVKVDLQFSQYLFSERSPVIVSFLFWITQLASRYACVIIGALYTVIMLRRRKRVYVIVLWSILLGLAISIHFSKLVFHRARPVDIAYYIEDNFSFPSGHSATAMVLYGFIAYTFFRLSKKPLRAVAPIICCVLVLLVGFSRIYLGVHFLSDVLGGFLFGFLWVVLGISLVEWQEAKKRSALSQTNNPTNNP